MDMEHEGNRERVSIIKRGKYRAAASSAFDSLFSEGLAVYKNNLIWLVCGEGRRGVAIVRRAASLFSWFFSQLLGYLLLSARPLSLFFVRLAY